MTEPEPRPRTNNFNKDSNWNDPYRWFAAELFSIRYKDVTDVQRQHAKSVAFAAQFGPEGTPTLAVWRRALLFAGLTPNGWK